MHRWALCFLIILSFACANRPAIAQTDTGKQIMLGAVIENGDTFGMVYLDDVFLIDKLPKKWAKKQAQFDRLKRNVYVTYPYAVIAAGVLKDVDAQLAKIPDKKAQKEYMKSIEKELKKRFKGELENLTISQGQVLVKLINRQSGRNVFGIIKEVKGGFNAVVYQSVALLFSNNLKREYDPQGDDRDIEAIVQELEAANFYRYQYYQQQKQQQQKRN
ncbi:MAG TPA: DUF4294 domain-containing protein [Flavipsychrobacter sp.]|nr:DUF4294 domain-containing protein [Flavipsychrobacter sp.]